MDPWSWPLSWRRAPLQACTRTCLAAWSALEARPAGLPHGGWLAPTSRQACMGTCFANKPSRGKVPKGACMHAGWPWARRRRGTQASGRAQWRRHACMHDGHGVRASKTSAMPQGLLGEACMHGFGVPGRRIPHPKPVTEQLACWGGACMHAGWAPAQPDGRGPPHGTKIGIEAFVDHPVRHQPKDTNRGREAL